MAFFDGGRRAPSLTWKDRNTLGKPRGGTIVQIDGLDPDNPIYARDFHTKQIKTWGSATPENPNPKPVEQLIITVQTNEKDLQNPLDDGKRCIYIEKESLTFSKNYAIAAKRGLPKDGTPYAALLAALEKAGSPKDIKVGGKYFMAWIGEEESPADKPRKIYAAKYEPPASSFMSQSEKTTGEVNPFDSPQTVNPFDNGQSVQSVTSTSNPFEDSTAPVADPTEIAREALKLELSDAPSKERIIELHRQHQSIWTDEMTALGKKRIEQLANPPQSQPLVAANPFE